MPDRFPPADLSRVRTYPLAERTHKVTVEQFGAPVNGKGSLAAFLQGLPRVLGAQTLHDLADGVPALDQRVGSTQIGGGDWRQASSGGAANAARFDQRRHLGEQPVLLDHIGRLQRRAREHQLPRQRERLRVRLAHIER